MSGGCDSKYNVSDRTPKVSSAAFAGHLCVFLRPVRCNKQPALAACRRVSRSTDTPHILLCLGDIVSCIIDGAPVAFSFDGQVFLFSSPDAAAAALAALSLSTLACAER